MILIIGVSIGAGILLISVLVGIIVLKKKKKLCFKMNIE